MWQKVSQILGPRPSAATAPSIWYAAVAAPQTKSSGKLYMWSPLVASCLCRAPDRRRLPGLGWVQSLVRSVEGSAAKAHDETGAGRCAAVRTDLEGALSRKG